MATKWTIPGLLTGQTVYAVVRTDGTVWNGAAFEVFNAANWTTYAVALAEQGSTGDYVLTFPAGIAAAGVYSVAIRYQAGGSPAVTDTYAGGGAIEWDGSAVVPLSSRLAPTVAGRTLDVSATGEAGLDWANVGSPTTAVAFTNTTISSAQQVDVREWKGNPVASDVAGIPNVNLSYIHSTGITEGSPGNLAAAFSYMFDVGVPVFTVASAKQTGDSYSRIGAGGAGLTSLTPAAWGARDLGNGRTADHYLQGLVNRLEWSADGTTFTLYSTDDLTVLYEGTGTRLPADVAGLRSVDPT